MKKKKKPLGVLLFNSEMEHSDKDLSVSRCYFVNVSVLCLSHYLSRSLWIPQICTFVLEHAVFLYKILNRSYLRAIANELHVSWQQRTAIDVLIIYSQTRTLIIHTCVKTSRQYLSQWHRLIMPCESNWTIDVKLGYFLSQHRQDAYTSYKQTRRGTE